MNNLLQPSIQTVHSWLTETVVLARKRFWLVDSMAVISQDSKVKAVLSSSQNTSCFWRLEQRNLNDLQ
ncbi:MAG: hypothetical protein PHY16_19920 [Methylobacter sp.]|nr:hypothetical protein [Methylobacter sp.]